MSTNDAADPAPPLASAVPHNAEAHHGPAFPVVGIGASAGGLEAISELLENLSPQPGLAFLVAVHLAPHHKTELYPHLRNCLTSHQLRFVNF